MAKKWESYYSLHSDMMMAGFGGNLSDAEDFEMMSSKRPGERLNRGKIQERLLDWMNAPAMKGHCDLTYHRASYCMIDAIKKAYRKRGRR